MANFDIAYNRVARAEGGYQNNPNDRGNYNSLDQLVGTNWGITSKVYEAHLGFPPSQQDMINMSINTAKIIYKKNYWDVILGDSIYNQFVADIIFDGRVNHGQDGVRLLQEVLNIRQDGAFGPITLMAVNNSDSGYLYNAYKKRRILFYREIVNSSPNQSIFLNGWLRRMEEFVDFPETVIVSTPIKPVSEPTFANNTGLVIGLFILIGSGIFFSHSKNNFLIKKKRA